MARSSETLESLPDYADLKKAPSKSKTIQLLQEGHQLRHVMQEADARLKEIKSELSQIQLINELPGVRYGNLCFIASERAGRATLSKEKLIDNGVSPEQIAASMSAGAPYIVAELQVIGEKKEKEY